MIAKNRYNILISADINNINKLIIKYLNEKHFVQFENYYVVKTNQVNYYFKYNFSAKYLLIEIWTEANDKIILNKEFNIYAESLNHLFEEIDKINYLAGGKLNAYKSPLIKNNKKKTIQKPKTNIKITTIIFYFVMITLPLSLFINYYAYLLEFIILIIIIYNYKKINKKDSLIYLILVFLSFLITTFYLFK